MCNLHIKNKVRSLSLIKREKYMRNLDEMNLNNINNHILLSHTCIPPKVAQMKITSMCA
jgi:hypothetical protein